MNICRIYRQKNAVCLEKACCLIYLVEAMIMLINGMTLVIINVLKQLNLEMGGRSKICVRDSFF